MQQFDRTSHPFRIWHELGIREFGLEVLLVAQLESLESPTVVTLDGCLRC